jgi:predicted AAA+ superfamily ATPase
MKKFLNVNAKFEEIKYWREKGYEVVFVFTPEAITQIVRPDYAKSITGQMLDPELRWSN